MIASHCLPSQERPARIALVPLRSFLELSGLPENVRDLGADTTVGFFNAPYVQTADVPDFPDELLAQLGRESFGSVPFVKGTTWEFTVLFALHTVPSKLGNLAVGRSGFMAWIGPAGFDLDRAPGLDVPSAINKEVTEQRAPGTDPCPQLQIVTPEEGARFIKEYEAAQR
jgi:hypothetical protein